MYAFCSDLNTVRNSAATEFTNMLSFVKKAHPELQLSCAEEVPESLRVLVNRVTSIYTDLCSFPLTVGLIDFSVQRGQTLNITLLNEALGKCMYIFNRLKSCPESKDKLDEIANCGIQSPMDILFKIGEVSVEDCDSFVTFITSMLPMFEQGAQQGLSQMLMADPSMLQQ
jgi:hypothetical protein